MQSHCGAVSETSNPISKVSRLSDRDNQKRFSVYSNVIISADERLKKKRTGTKNGKGKDKRDDTYIHASVYIIPDTIRSLYVLYWTGAKKKSGCARERENFFIAPHCLTACQRYFVAILLKLYTMFASFFLFIIVIIFIKILFLIFLTFSKLDEQNY